MKAMYIAPRMDVYSVAPSEMIAESFGKLDDNNNSFNGDINPNVTVGGMDARPWHGTLGRDEW